MINITDNTKCSGCAACFNSCPVQAITMKADKEGFLYPHVDENICINCDKCVKVCPYIELHSPTLDLEKCYAAYNKNNNDRAISSSGGIFILLAKEILKQNGIVYGAAFDEDYMVFHTFAENEIDLQRLVGSKYVQSQIGNVYKQVKLQLQEGRSVLFAGTSCQIGGLCSFLGKDYDNLICIDFICLGIPSPRVWNDYLDTFFDRKKVKHINFKDKSLGWHTFSLRIDSDKDSFVRNGRNTYFFSGFFKGLYSRPSCSNCVFKSGNRVSDITISDCWGYSKIAPEMDDNRGLSSIVIHSQKGRVLFEKIQDLLVCKETALIDVQKYNSNYCTSAPMGEKREEFWDNYEYMKLKQLFKKYCRLERQNTIILLFKKLKNKVSAIIKAL